ncbi:MAG: T9SS type A sorting domain-containing protein [Bacteroidota bacterium]
MKHCIFLIMILMMIVAVPAFAQDYRLINTGRTALFSDENFEIKCIRIDSVHTEISEGGEGIDSVFYPMGNIQFSTHPYTDCATPFGASWTGKKVVVKPDGEHLFFNKYEDTIWIKSSAGLHESWRVYESDVYIIEARVLEHDTMSFLGLTDSVKIIGFKVHDRNMLPMDHTLNMQTIRISKHYGAIRILNYYQFPDFEGLNYGFVDEYLTGYELAGLSAPQTGLQNFTWFGVFDFHPGDEIHTLLDESVWYNEPGEHSLYERTIKRFLDREDYPDSLVYTYERKVSIHAVDNSVTSTSFVHDTATLVIRRNPEFDLLPGEVIIQEGWAWSHFMHGGETPGKTVPTGALGIWRSLDDSCWTYCCADGCFMDENYLKGLGGPYGSCSNAFSGGGIEKKLIYYKKGDKTWGVPYDLTGTEPARVPLSLRIYPIPASDHLWIESAEGPIREVILMDLSGKVMLRQAGSGSKELLLKISHLSPGIFLVKVISGEAEHTSKIVIARPAY